MVDSVIVAESLVHRYLNGRTMDPIMFAAVAWAVAKRLNEGLVPTLSVTLCHDIDSQAVAIPPDTKSRDVQHSFFEPGSLRKTR
ncbi:UNVERIFIED_ORG: hypothetical protein J2W38_007090 [Variovorax paradoxus]|nr:hypothetical protein [Variovorax paradoxus]